jgi:protein TonB
MSGLAGVVFIDAGAGAAQAGVAAQLTLRLHSQLPDVVLVVAGDGAAQSELTALITDGTIYRFVHKPVSAQRVKLFVDAAWRKHNGTSSGATGQYPALSLSQTMPILPMPGPRPWPALAAGAVAVGMAVAWYALRSPPPAPTPTPPAPQLAAPAPAAAPSVAAAPIAPEQVLVTARRHVAMADRAAHLRAAPPLVMLPVPVPAPVTVPIPTIDLSPLVAANPATIPDVSVSSVPVTEGPPTSTPPVSEARDRLSVAAVILERVYWVDPEFPEIAREQDLTGFVDLEFMVHADGSVSDVTVLRAHPLGVFEKSAVAAVQQWRYRPVERDGIAVD